MNFALWFYYGFLHSMGWPRKVGLRRREVVNSTVADLAAKQLLDMGRSIGASDPDLAASLIGNIFQPQWSAEQALALVTAFEAQHDAGWRPLASMGAEIPWEFLAHDNVRTIISVGFTAELWHGVCNPQEVSRTLDSELVGGRARAALYKEQGLEVEPRRVPESGQEYFGMALTAVEEYELAVEPLSPPPPPLLDLGLARRAG